MALGEEGCAFQARLPRGKRAGGALSMHPDVAELGVTLRLHQMVAELVRFQIPLTFAASRLHA